MGIDSSIPLQGVSPVKTFADLANAQALQAQTGYHMQQQQLAQQQTQQAAMANQQQAQQIADQQTIQQHMADPTNARAIGAGDFSKLAGKVLPGTMFGLQKTIMDAQEAAQKLDKTKLENYTTRHGEFAATIDGLMALPQEARQQAYTQALSSLAANGHTQGIDLPQTIDVSDEGLKKLAAVNGVYAGLYDKALSRKKEQAATGKDVSQGKEFEANAAKARAGIPALEAEGIIKQAQAKNMTDTGLLPEESAKLQQAQAALQQAQAHFEQTKAEMTRHNRAEEGLSARRLGLEGARNSREEKIYQQTYGEGANPALVGVEPKLRSQAASAATKIISEYETAKKSADDLQTVLDLTKKGNKAGAANVPLMGVEALNAVNGIKRINKAEIDQYGHAGSLVDKIQGKLGGWVSGQPIPAGVLKDIEELHTSLRNNLEKGANDKLGGVNQTYRSNFTLPSAQAAGGATTGGYQAGHVYGGMTFKGGDPNNKANWTK